MSAPFQLPALEPLRHFAPQAPVDAGAILAVEIDAARERGYAEGLAQARAEVQAELATAVAAVAAAAAEMTARRDALCDAVEPAAVSLALAGAEQVIGAALAVQPELIEHAARGALRRLVERDHVVMLVSPEDLDHMRSYATELADQLGGIDALDVQAERRVRPGSVIVQTPVGDVDARLDTRLVQLGEVVRDALAR